MELYISQGVSIHTYIHSYIQTRMHAGISVNAFFFHIDCLFSVFTMFDNSTGCM